jgi:hypothetical protein
MSPSFAAASSSFSTPSARHMRRSLPNWLIRSGCDEPYAPQLAFALEERDPLAEVSGRGHTLESMNSVACATI